MNYTGSYKHRFYLSFDGGATYTEIKPVKRVGVKKVKEKDQWFFRNKTVEWKFKYSENESVYTTFAGLLANVATITDEILAKIDCYEDFETYSYTEFLGVIPIAGIVVDEDEGVMQFTPDPKDAYTWYDELKDIKYNISANPSGTMANEVVTYNTTTVLYLIFRVNTGGPPPVGASGFSIVTHAAATYTVGEHYSTTDGEAGFYYKGWCRGSDLNTYKCIQAHDGAYGKEPTGVSGYLYWALETMFTVYAQVQMDTNIPSYTQGNGEWDTGFPDNTTLTTGATNCSIDHWYQAGDTVATFATTVTNYGRPLFDFTGGYNGILNAFLLLNSLTFGVVSDFFSLATNPVSGTTNHLTNVILTQVYNIKYPLETLQINKIDYCFADLFTLLLRQFNCYWYMDGTDIRIEHRKYFENGYSYAGAMAVGVDLTDQSVYLPKYQVLNSRDIDSQGSSNSYTFNGGEYVQFEQFLFMNTEARLGQVEYPSAMVKKGKITKIDLSQYITDIYYIYQRQDEVSDDALCVMACNSSNVIYRRDVALLESIIQLDTVNGDLFWGNLLLDWHKYGRQLTSGIVNGNAVTFISVVPLRKQIELRFPRFAEFDPMKYVTTYLGNGITESAELNTETDFIKIQLLYP